MADDVKQLPADDTTALPTGEETPTLAAGDDTSALPAGYEVVASDEQTVDSQVAQAEQFGEELMATQNIIQRYSEQYDQLNTKIKDLREMLKNLYDNDEELQTKEEEAKTLTQDVRQRKQRIKESPEAIELQMKMKEMGEEKKEIEETLNNHLLRYYTLTGSQVIEEADGSEREFKINARLKGKKAA